MGQKRDRLGRFLNEHPLCCLCGGTLASETIEHAPPKVMFTGSHRPKGLEVPACKRCNNGMSAHDQIVALHCLLQSVKLFGKDAKNTLEFVALEKAIRGIGNNNPDVFGYLSPDGRETFRLPDGIASLLKIRLADDLFEKYLDPWAAKQVLAYWYDRTKSPATTGTIVLVRWITLAEFSNNKELRDFAGQFGNFRSLAQGNWDTKEQFFAISSDNFIEKLGAFFFAYHNSASFFGALIDNPDIQAGKLLSPNNQFSVFRPDPSLGLVRI